MKKIFFVVFAVSPLMACTQLERLNTPPSVNKIGMANPASQYCIDQGGSLSIQNKNEGQVGYCQLPNGQVIEEWQYYHQQAKVCQQDRAQTLIGHTFKQDTELKQLTHAQFVRVINPNQAVTQDYREERLTVVIDPTTQKILQANCG